MTAIPDNVIKRILSEDQSWRRFETFCCELITELTGHDVLPTSKSYDLARDGRSPLQASSELIFAACTLQSEVDQKMRDDLERMLNFGNPSCIYFCTTANKSEYALEHIRSELQTLSRNVELVEVLALDNLVGAAQRYPKAFQHRYAGELYELQDFLKEKSFGTEKWQVEGMHTALATQLLPDSRELRHALLRNLVLKALHDHGPLTLSRLAKFVSDALRLPRVISHAYFLSALDELENAGHIQRRDNLHALTDQGQVEQQALRGESSKNLSEGRDLVRKAIGELLGEDLGDNPFSSLWKAIQEEIAQLFFGNGLSILRTLASLTDEGPDSSPLRPLSHHLDGVRSRIASMGIGGARSEEVAQAVVDLFSDADSEAFDWLSSLAIKYVGMCSLGLDPAAQQEICARLADINIIIDTDVVLSLLSEGERPHKVIEETLNAWAHLGSRIIVPDAVMQEAAYHAWISTFEFYGVWRLLQKVEPHEVNRYARNAFVRAFYAVSKDNLTQRRWDRYIAEYRGTDDSDASRITDILRDKGFEVANDVELNEEFAHNARQLMFSERGFSPRDAVPKAVGDKIYRDGTLLAHLRACRDAADHPFKSTIVASSSPILRRVGQLCFQNQDEPDAVWTPTAVAYLLSLVPGVRFTQSSLQRALFAESDRDSLDEVTRLAMRVIRQSDEYEIGFSRRPRLKREMAKQINGLAVQLGKTPRSVASDLASSPHENQALIEEVIANAIDQIAASKTERDKRGQ